MGKVNVIFKSKKLYLVQMSFYEHRNNVYISATSMMSQAANLPFNQHLKNALFTSSFFKAFTASLDVMEKKQYLFCCRFIS